MNTEYVVIANGKEKAVTTSILRAKHVAIRCVRAGFTATIVKRERQSGSAVTR